MRLTGASRLPHGFLIAIKHRWYRGPHGLTPFWRRRLVRGHFPRSAAVPAATSLRKQLPNSPPAEVVGHCCARGRARAAFRVFRVFRSWLSFSASFASLRFNGEPDRLRKRGRLQGQVSAFPTVATVERKKGRVGTGAGVPAYLRCRRPLCAPNCLTPRHTTPLNMGRYVSVMRGGEVVLFM